MPWLDGGWEELASGAPPPVHPLPHPSRARESGEDMVLKDIFHLGSLTSYLRLQTEVLSFVKGEAYILGSMSDVLSLLEIYELCKTMTKEHRNTIEYFVEKYDNATEITEEDAEKLEKYTERLRRRIRVELDELSVIILKGSSGLDKNELEKLSEGDPSEFFEKELWDKLSEIERNDYANAARCLLVEIPTPSVMVSLRGAEASLRHFYHEKSKNDPGKMTWRQMTKDLKDNVSSYGIEESL